MFRVCKQTLCPFPPMCRIGPEYILLVIYDKLELRKNQGVFPGCISGVFKIAGCIKTFRMKSWIELPKVTFQK